MYLYAIHFFGRVQSVSDLRYWTKELASTQTGYLKCSLSSRIAGMLRTSNVALCLRWWTSWTSEEGTVIQNMQDILACMWIWAGMEPKRRPVAANIAHWSTLGTMFEGRKPERFPDSMQKAWKPRKAQISMLISYILYLDIFALISYILIYLLLYLNISQ